MFISLKTFFHWVSSSINLLGSIFLVKGILKFSPDLIAEYSRTKWGYNLNHLKNISYQKADFLCGFTLVIFSFILEILNPLIPYRYFKFEKNIIEMVVILMAIIFFVIFSIIINNYLRNKFTEDSKKELASQIIRDYFKTDVINNNVYDAILNIADNISDIQKRENKSVEKFIIRYSNHLNIEVPKDLDIDVKNN